MASVLKVDKLDPQSGTALEIGTSGDTISVPSGATLDISASTLTPPATMPASSGVNLTALNATNLGSGTVPTARLGTGTASSSTVLYGDQTYKAEPGGGKVLQVVQGSFRNGETSTTSGTVVDSGATVVITPSASSSKILVMFTSNSHSGAATSTTAFYDISRAISGGATTAGIIGAAAGAPTTQGLGGDSSSYGIVSVQYLDSPSTTSAITYRLMLARWFGSSTVYLGNGATNDWCMALEIDGS